MAAEATVAADRRVDLWVERYRPATFDDYVWQDPTQRCRAEQWIAAGMLPHLLFHGPPGVGKTSLAKLLLRQLQIPDADILEINASRERGVADIQSRWQNFVQSFAFGASGLKYVLFDEADAMSSAAQRMLRGDLETYSTTCRVIFTCNYPLKLIPALHDRCQKMEFVALDRDEFLVRIGMILSLENITYDIDTLSGYLDRAYPSLRKCINLTQEHILAGRLAPLAVAEDHSGRDYILDSIQLFRRKDYITARKLIVAQAALEEFPDIYRFLYHNLDLFGPTQHQQDDALVIIAQGVRDHAITADPEINLAATLVRLTHIAEPPAI